MRVFVRTIPVAERSAFAWKAPPAMDLLPINNNSNRKVSPSAQHLQLIHKLQHATTHIRQLAFTPSVGASSDVLYENDGPQQQQQQQTTTSTWNRKERAKQRDGRYRSIDPVQATLSALPNTPPLLSNKKHRLPWRADVGFPNASLQELQNKQLEIQQETEWEEASPRLIVLVTSDDLGTAVAVEGEGGGSYYAGPELVQAKERNQRHFSRRHLSSGGGGTTSSTTSTSTSASATIRTSTTAAANRYSMLAPPLDATYSATLGWRPRPFHDRPPGMAYALVCPLEVQFAVGTIEPLVCSMSLYSCRNSNSNTSSISGKASEDFWFPAGDWKGKIDIDAVRGDADLTELWHGRKHKAIFSYDPLVVNTHDLFLVLQVYKAAHLDSAAAYRSGTTKPQQHTTTTTTTTTTSSSSTSLQQGLDRKSWRRCLKKRFQKEGEHADLDRTTYRASAVFERFGTQLLSPLCFGITPLYPPPTGNGSNGSDGGDSTTWPKGQIQQGMSMHCYPPQSESQEDFVQRLCSIVARQQPSPGDAGSVKNASQPQLSTLHESSSSSSKEDHHTTKAPSSSVADSSVEFSSPSKKKGVRRFMSPRKPSKKDSSSLSSSPNPKAAAAAAAVSNSKPTEDTPIIAATVTLFSSALDVDFLQSMLQTPTELTERVVTAAKALPKILVDISGESAIMMDSKKGHDAAKKRSNLVRLPSRSGGYLDESDFREVLFLPPRPPKTYTVDVPPSYRSLLNLLYLYPRLLLRQDSSSSSTVNTNEQQQKRQKGHRQRYTVRIRLVQSLAETKQESDIVEATNKTLTNFHNPAPWAGPSLLRSVYTRIPGDVSSSNHHHHNKQQDDLKAGIPLKDEFKLRLPMVLDGNYFLQFTLFTVDMQDDLDDSASYEMSVEEGCGLSLQPIADTTIPLSSSSTRDPTSGIKATTIIPNGCHRLKIGDFQLQVETRLVSSIHVSDPSIATALRDFPFANDEGLSGERLQELTLQTSRTVVSRQSSRDSIPGKVSFTDLFSTASGSALLGHFQPLLFMHLSNLVNVGDTTRGAETSEQFLVENMQSFLEICRRVKASFLTSHLDGQKRFEAFVKATIDSFDEATFHSSSLKEDPEEDTASEVMQMEPSRSTPSIVPSESGDDEEQDDEFDGGAIRKRKKSSLRSEIDTRISRTFSAMEASEVPFSRTAYGASKTDRMRLEAERDADVSRFTHLVDDDETVVTLATGFSGDARMSDARDAFEKIGTPKTFKDTLGESHVNSIEESDAGVSHHDFSYQALKDFGLAKRVRSAAQVMLAPCVTPDLANVFNNSPRHASSTTHENKKPTKSEVPPSKPEKLAELLQPVSLFIVCRGGWVSRSCA
jgi:hypothetical protein